jgi:uncharacterized protein (TIRG00374 family)
VLRHKLAFGDVFRVGMGLAISGFFVWFLVSKLNISHVLSLLLTASAPWIAAAVGMLCVDYFLRAVRWWLMIRKESPRVSLGVCLCVLLAGFAANNVLPLRAGDVMRAFWFRGRLLSSSGYLLGTLILERTLDLLTLLIIWLIVITTTHFQLPHPGLVRVVSLMTILGILALGTMLTMAARIESILIRVVHALFGGRPIVEKLVSAAQPVFTVFKKSGSRLMLSLIALSGGAWVLEGTVFWMVARALHLPIVAASPWLAFVFGNFAAMIPSAPGYIGTFHAAVIGTLITMGWEQNAAGSFAILVHAILWIGVTAAGTFAYFVSSGKRSKSSEVERMSVPIAS